MMSTASHRQIDSHYAPAQPLWEDNLRNGIWPRQNVVWVVAFYIALFILRPWETLVPELADLRFERVMVVFVLGMTLLARGVMVKISHQSVALLLLFAAIWLSTRNAYNPIASSQELTEFLGLVISFFVIQKTVRTPYQLFFLVACYFVATTVYVFKSEWEFLINGNGYDSMGVLRMKGIDETYGHPNSVGSKILCSIPFLVFFYKTRDEFCARWPKIFKKLFTWMIYGYGAASVAGILFTRSRTAAVGLVVLTLILVLRKRGLMKKLKWAMIAAFGFAVIFFASPENVRERIQSVWDKSLGNANGARTSAEGRIEGLRAGITIYRRFPVSGVGIGSFRDYREDHVDHVPLDAHNLPGELLGETGTIGFVAFAYFLMSALFNCKKLKKLGRTLAETTDNQVYLLLGVACFDGFLMLMWGGIAGHNLQAYQWYWYAAFVLMGIHFVQRAIVEAESCDWE